jgi:hypothetical protein
VCENSNLEKEKNKKKKKNYYFNLALEKELFKFQ